MVWKAGALAGSAMLSVSVLLGVATPLEAAAVFIWVLLAVYITGRDEKAAAFNRREIERLESRLAQRECSRRNWDL